MAIPTKDKDILLLPVIDGGVTQLFNMPGFAGYNSKKAKHNGLDLGWTKTMYCDILACQDGTVVDVYNNNSSFGNGIVLQHDYSDGHRFTGYVHLKNAPKLKKGAKVKQGDVIGVRGGSPYVNGKAKYGVHLHLYVTKVIKTAYSWNVMKANVIDPLPLLYKSKAVKYNVLASSSSAKMNSLKYIEDVRPEVVEPVDRDDSKNQLTEKASNLRVRTAPSLSASVIGFLQPNVFYNYYEVKNADGFEWYQIADEQWCAKTSTMTVLPGITELEKLQDKYNILLAENEELQSKIAQIKKLVE